MTSFRAKSRAIAIALAAASIVGLAGLNHADPPKKSETPDAPAKKPATPRGALLTMEAWQNAPLGPVAHGEIDKLVAKELQAAKIEPAPLTTDEQFIRRVTLDLTGNLPTPAEVSEFAGNSDPAKRSKLIDK